MGMEGEGILQNEVFVVKSHFPERVGREEFNCSKVIVILRNPLDSMASLFNMIATGSHSESISEEKLEKADDLWEQFIE